jgi:hypothetical protein
VTVRSSGRSVTKRKSIPPGKTPIAASFVSKKVTVLPDFVFQVQQISGATADVPLHVRLKSLT